MVGSGTSEDRIPVAGAEHNRRWAISAFLAAEEGREKREELLAAARRDIEAETRRSLERIRKEVADLTVLTTEKVVRKSLSADDHKRLIDEALKDADFATLSGNREPRDA